MDTANRRIQVAQLVLTNFRGFRDHAPVPLAPLTFVVGPNSSGKSSIFDALLLLAQSRFAPIGSFVPRWNGQLVDLGSYRDTVYGHKPRLRIGISIDVLVEAPINYLPPRQVDHLSPFRIDYQLKVSKAEPVGILDTVRVTDIESMTLVEIRRTSQFRVSLTVVDGERVDVARIGTSDVDQTWSRAVREVLRKFAGRESRPKNTTPRERALRRLQSVFSFGALETLLHGTERVSSGRGGPQRWYSIGATARELARSAGRPSLFDTVDPSVLSPLEEARSQRRARKIAAELRKEVGSRLESLGIADQIQSASISPYHAALEVRDSVTKISSNIMEVGYGASQVLPVIRACLSKAVGPLFVEQPEIHLHPKAQGAVAEMLCEAAKQRQVIIETHSVHMINRARLRIAKGELPSSEVMVLFTSRTREGSRVLPIPLDDKGDFTVEWPGGFFDERYEDTKQLLRLRHSPRGDA